MSTTNPTEKPLTEREQLIAALYQHLGFNDKDGTYYYCLTRVKEGFSVGTVSLDDFEEIDEEFVGELADVFESALTSAYERGRTEMREEAATSVSLTAEQFRATSDTLIPNKESYAKAFDSQASVIRQLPTAPERGVTDDTH